MTTREPARPLQRLWIARGRAASLPSTYTTLRDATLKWQQVDLNRGMVFLNPEDWEQNGKDRATVPLNGQIMTALGEARDMAITDYVIEYKSGPVADIKKGIALAAFRTGIKCHPHMFRHSAAVWMAEDRVPMEEIASFLGHRNVQITIRVYARFHPDYLRQAAKSLEW